MVKLGVIEEAPPRRLPSKKVPPISTKLPTIKPIETPTADPTQVSEQAARKSRGNSKAEKINPVGGKKIKKGKE